MSVLRPLQEHQVYIEAGKPAEHWVLRMAAEFSAVQVAIDSVLTMHLRQRSPALGHKIARKHFRRLSDEDRWEYLKALAEDAGYSGGLLTDASEVFRRAKRVRDLVGHHPEGLELVRSQENPEYHYDTRGAEAKDMTGPLTPLAFRQLGAECRWIVALVDHIAFIAGQTYVSPFGRADESGRPQAVYLRMLEPPALPIAADWTADELRQELPSDEDSSAPPSTLTEEDQLSPPDAGR